MDLSVRAINCLKRSGHNTIQDVLNAYYDESLIEVRNLGRKCYDEVVKKLIELGFVDHV
jgi:DNA-directed RNA polymerase alpha subunit